MMYRIDVYSPSPKKGSKDKKNNKFLTSHWYPTKEEAEDAKFALIHMPKKEYTFIPGENRKQKTMSIGGYHVTGPVEDTKY